MSAFAIENGAMDFEEEMRDQRGQHTVYVVDDDPSLRKLLCAWLQQAGYLVEAFDEGRSALQAIERKRPSLVCLDVMMPGLDGIAVLRRIRELDGGADLPVAVLTARDTVETAVSCMRLGALDYVLKPVDAKALVAVMDRGMREVSQASQLGQPAAANVPAAAAATAPSRAVSPNSEIIGRCPSMLSVYREIDKIAPSNITVFIGGETGTGKELVAREIHRRSKCSGGPFVALNCGAIAETLQESELFGHEKGALTGATSTRQGRFEQANGGTIFLDEVGELSPAAQIRLLRVLQERVLERVGGRTPSPLTVRVLSATHKDLRAAVKAGTFREDLYYRLFVLPLSLPPLRDRGHDIDLLTEHFLNKYADEVPRPINGITSRALAALRRHRWPGNVRELENTIYGAMVRADREVLDEQDLRLPTLSEPVPVATLTPDKFPPAAHSGIANAASIDAARASSSAQARPAPVAEAISMEEVEQRAIVAALDATAHNVTQAAKRLGIGRATLYRKMDRYGIKRS